MRNQKLQIIITIILSILIALLIDKGLPELITILNIERISNTNLRLLFYIVTLTIFASVLFRSSDAYNKLPWLLFILAWPEAAIILFLSISRNFKDTSRYKRRTLMHGKSYIIKENYKTDFNKIEDPEIRQIYNFGFRQSGHPVYLYNSDVKLLFNGEQAFPELIKRLEEAENYIFMEFYIIRTDKIGRKILDILKLKAEQGLEVRLHVDFLGKRGSSRAYLNTLKKSGVRIVVQDPFIVPVFNTKITYRLHRKITVIDGKYAFTGGLNLGDEYNNDSKVYAYWRDTHIMVTGEAVKSLLTILLKDWYYVTGELVTDKKYFKTTVLEKTNTIIETLQSGPDSITPIISNTYMKMINLAKESIVIYTPYVAPSRSLKKALELAAMSGVKVTIIIPDKADKLFVYAMTNSYLPSLLKAGVKIKKYKNAFVHSKVLIIDNKIASVGSFNFDQRSEHINFEDTVIFSGEHVQEITDKYHEDLTHCRDYTYQDYLKTNVLIKNFYALLSIFAPLL